MATTAMSAGVQTLLSRQAGQGATVGVNDSIMKTSVIADPNEATWPVGCKTKGMKDLSKEELKKRMFARTSINGRKLNNPVIGIALDTTMGAKVLYINSLRKTVVPYEEVNGMIQQAEGDPVHADGQVYSDVMTCANAGEVLDKVLFQHELEVKSVSAPVQGARFNNAGEIIGLRKQTVPTFEYA